MGILPVVLGDASLSCGGRLFGISDGETGQYCTVLLYSAVRHGGHVFTFLVVAAEGYSLAPVASHFLRGVEFIFCFPGGDVGGSCTATMELACHANTNNTIFQSPVQPVDPVVYYGGNVPGRHQDQMSLV